MLVIGLTGGIASGKSTVSDSFAKLGAPVVDADVLAREVVQPGSDGLNALISYFTTAILTPKGELDRAALRRIVFANPPDRAFLDKTLHPRIRALSEARIEEARKESPAYVIYAVPLLVETSQQNRFDRIVVVDVPEDVQLSRLMNRDNAVESEARAILAAQTSREERLAIADDVIDNSTSIEQTIARVKELHDQYVSLSSTTPPTHPPYSD